MNLRAIVIAGLGLIVMGCAEREQAVTEPADATQSPEATAMPEAPWEIDDSWRNADFMEHMHLHAEKLDELNFSLADGDLEGAMEPARWLSTHDTYTDVQSEWLPYLYAMREEARIIETAPDLATARAASERITVRCQACHAAAGMGVQ